MQEELFDKYLSGSMAPEDELRLAQLLKDDPAVGEALVRHVRETTLLVQVASQVGAAQPARRRSSRFRDFRARGPRWGLVAAAAAVLFLLAVLVALPPGGKTAPKPSTVDHEIRRAEERLCEIRQKEEELAAPRPVAAAPDPEADRKREEERARLRAERERIELDMKAAIERAPKPGGPRKVEERREEPGKSDAPPQSLPDTKATVATVREMEGDVRLGKVRAGPGQAVLAGEGLETAAGSRAVVEFPDGTRVRLDPETRVRDVQPKRLHLEGGALVADVTRQVPGKSMVFTTPHAEATVLGTTLRILIEADATRLEVTEGRVRLKRLSDGQAVEVAHGHFAVAAAGLPLVEKALPISEIVLLPSKALRAGRDWALVPDDQASTRKALEASAVRSFDQSLSLLKGNSLGFVEFAFIADADTTYQLWVRGRCTAAKDRELHDGVAIEVPGSTLSDQFLIPNVPGGSDRVYVSGFGARAGYTWVCRAGDHFEQTPAVTVRFNRPGPQKLRMFAIETPVRIDAVWLSATQKTRPADEQPAPAIK